MKSAIPAGPSPDPFRRLGFALVVVALVVAMIVRPQPLDASTVGAKRWSHPVNPSPNHQAPARQLRVAGRPHNFAVDTS
jgi:hypothetical protein